MAKDTPDTVASLHEKYVGKTALMAVELSLRFRVTIKDVRPKYGRVDVLVTPIEGDGEKWVSDERLSEVT